MNTLMSSRASAELSSWSSKRVVGRGIRIVSAFSPSSQISRTVRCLSTAATLPLSLQKSVTRKSQDLTYHSTSKTPLWIRGNSSISSSTSPQFSTDQGTSLTKMITKDSWDSHMHVVDPDNYALHPSAQYTPTPHLLSDAMQFESSVGISNIVLVQPSIYGNDNSCMLDALRELGSDRGRAVVTFDPETISAETLKEWHQIGVRGVRVNFQSVGKKVEASELEASLKQYANVIKPFNWIIQLYVPLLACEILEKVVPELGVRVCIDHFGHPSLPDPGSKSLYSQSSDPYALPGFGSLINLLKAGNTYLKLSAPYRISKVDDQSDLNAIAEELLRAAPDKLVFATDWPHTRFAGLNIRPYMETVLRWCKYDEKLVEGLFRKNAESLWDVKR